VYLTVIESQWVEGGERVAEKGWKGEKSRGGAEEIKTETIFSQKFTDRPTVVLWVLIWMAFS
jgi:hypothetical protein